MTIISWRVKAIMREAGLGDMIINPRFIQDHFKIQEQDEVKVLKALPSVRLVTEPTPDTSFSWMAEPKIKMIPTNRNARLLAPGDSGYPYEKEVWPEEARPE